MRTHSIIFASSAEGCLFGSAPLGMDRPRTQPPDLRTSGACWSWKGLRSISLFPNWSLERLHRSGLVYMGGELYSDGNGGDHWTPCWKLCFHNVCNRTGNISTAPGLGDGDKGSGGRRRQTRMGNKVENFSLIRHPLLGLPRWFSG